MTATALWIDTFNGDGTSRLGTRWMAFTDRVMGGLSDAEVRYDTIDGRACLHLEGTVRLENRGGFIQVALPLVTREHPFDATHLRGVRLLVRGVGAPFQVHLRSLQQRRPWEHYCAEAWAPAAWTTIDLPFAAFHPEMTTGILDLSRLTRIGIVLGKRPGPASLAVGAVGFHA
ncbi:MAG: CIA30 family protein [Candidatus Sericytochromatia bacterium]|nr:CIA30 family protein [Candidatus Sericytochromatia bacterium]